jgi:hypothetical protein
MTTVREQLERFAVDHGDEVLAALRAHERMMAAAATEARAAYDKVAADPALRAVQDQSLTTTAGLLHTATGCATIAKRAAGAATAWEALRDRVMDGAT